MEHRKIALEHRKTKLNTNTENVDRIDKWHKNKIINEDQAKDTS